MLSLIIDSSTKKLYLGLVNNDIIVEEKYIIGKNDHAEKIVAAVSEILNNNNFKIKDLDEVVCGVGPGSYTGVRMAVTVSKMLSHFANIKLRSVSTLALMGSNTNNALVMIDARRGNVFGAIISNGDFVTIEKHQSLDELKNNNYEIIIDEDNFIVNPLNVLRIAQEVKEPLLLVPNYLRDTEAERNLC